MIVAIVQARMGSSRLPGKVLAAVEGRPVLERVMERLRRARLVDRIVVATSVLPENGGIEELCARLDVECFRGAEQDVLDRYWWAARQVGTDAVVRVTADCPLLDPTVVDQVVARYIEGGWDYVANINPPTYPHGLDVEICSMSALERAWRDATADEREHVTLHIRRRQKRFRVANLSHQPDLSEYRLVVDYPRDLETVRAMYRAMGDVPFGLPDILALLERDPALAAQCRVPRQRSEPDLAIP